MNEGASIADPNIGAMPEKVAMEASHKVRLSDAAGLRGVWRSTQMIKPDCTRSHLSPWRMDRSSALLRNGSWEQMCCGSNGPDVPSQECWCRMICKKTSADEEMFVIPTGHLADVRRSADCHPPSGRVQLDGWWCHRHRSGSLSR